MTTKPQTVTHDAPIRHAIIPIHLLDGHKRNYRSHPETQLRKIEASLTRFQQVRSIVVKAQSNGRYMILAGHGVTEAAINCGIQELACDIVPDTWDELTCTAYLVADNMGGYEDDETALAALLQEQANAGYDLESLGSSQEELDALLERLADDIVPDFEPASEDAQSRLDEKQKVTCPHCGTEFVRD